MYDVVVKTFTFAISSTDEFLSRYRRTGTDPRVSDEFLILGGVINTQRCGDVIQINTKMVIKSFHNS